MSKHHKKVEVPCKLSDKWISQQTHYNPETLKKWKGTITALTENGFLVQWEHLKKPQRFHRDFIDVVTF